MASIKGRSKALCTTMSNGKAFTTRNDSDESLYKPYLGGEILAFYLPSWMHIDRDSRFNFNISLLTWFRGKGKLMYQQ